MILAYLIMKVDENRIILKAAHLEHIAIKIQ